MAIQRVVLLDVLNRETGQPELLGFADRGGRMTGPGDTPANVYFPGRLAQALNFEAQLFNGRTWWGSSRVGRGVIVLANRDGALDLLAKYSVDGRRWRLLEGPADSPMVDLVQVATGLMATLEMGLREVTIRVRDLFAGLATPVCANSYAGTDSGPTGVEGGADLKGKRKAISLGITRNVGLQLVNASSLMLQISDGPIDAVLGVWHSGAPWTVGTDYPTLAALAAATVPAATVATCRAEGYGKAGSRPTGTLTADIRGAKPGGVYLSSVADILRHLLTMHGGVDPSDIDAASFAALAAACPAHVGLRVEGEETVQSACDRLCASASAWYSHDASGRWHVGRLARPTGPAMATLADLLHSDPLECLPHQVTDDGMPAWRVTVRYGRNHTVQARSDLAAVITDDPAQAARVEWLGQQWREAVAEDATVKTAYPSAKEITVETCLDVAADAQALAAEILAMFRGPRNFWRVRAPLASLTGVELGQDVLLQHRRLGLAAGRLMTVTGVVRDQARRLARLTLWG